VVKSGSNWVVKSGSNCKQLLPTLIATTTGIHSTLVQYNYRALITVSF